MLSAEQQLRVSRINQIEAQIGDVDSVYVTSVDKPYGDPYWKAGQVSQARKHIASRLIVGGHMRVSTPEEIAAHDAARKERERQILAIELALKTQSVLVSNETSEMTVLKAQLEELKALIGGMKPEDAKKKKAEVQ